MKKFFNYISGNKMLPACHSKHAANRNKQRQEAFV